jgi:hypothetical protein
MLSGTLDDQYFVWLYSLVADVKTRKGPRTYWNLLRKLFCIEFAWIVPNDDNRAEDGRELRSEWAASADVDVDPLWASLGCSFLEMLIGLSRRLDFMTEQSVEYWFWHLMENMGFLGYNDRVIFAEEDVQDRVSVVIWRNYDQYGNGGLFPLQYSKHDQRKIEIWRQLNEYLLQDG